MNRTRLQDISLGDAIYSLRAIRRHRPDPLLFDIPDTAEVVYCIPIGYPKGRFGPVSRRPLDDVVSHDRWSAS